jgi:hypothetical protein
MTFPSTLAAAALAAVLASPAPAAAQAAARGAPHDAGTSRCGLDTLPLDSAAHACLECHAAGKDRGAPVILTHSSHPVDVDYRLTRPRATPLRSAPAAIARGVVMPANRVTCLSCHSGASRERSRMRMPMEDGPVASRLCNACHVMPGDEDGTVALGGRM